MLDYLVSIQVANHQTISADLAQFASSRDWWSLFAVLPLGILFGAVHALTPGHNKLVLATYVIGDRMAVARAAWVACALALTHIGSAVIISLVAGFLVSRTITSAGQAPLLENLSRYLLVAIGLWLVIRAIWPRPHVHGEGLGVGIIAGLVPCPLTLFVMVMAVSEGVPEAGLTFAGAMLIGVGSVLVATAILAVAIGRSLAAAIARHGGSLSMASRSLELVAGFSLTGIALAALLL
jgi:nickel/cobalt exporter